MRKLFYTAIAVLILASSSAMANRVICSAQTDEGSPPTHFLIVPNNVLMILPTDGASIFTLDYDDCWPLIPASPPKLLYSCQRKGEGFASFIEYDVNNLSWITLYAVADGSDSRFGSITIPMRCAGSVGAGIEMRLYD